MSLKQFFPPLETALQLEPEELAIPLLRCLIEEESRLPGQLNLHNFAGTGASDAYAGDKCPFCCILAYCSAERLIHNFPCTLTIVTILSLTETGVVCRLY